MRVAVLGLFLGAGLAYALIAWHRALMPQIQLLHADDEISIYEVHGEDASREYEPRAGGLESPEPPAGEEPPA